MEIIDEELNRWKKLSEKAASFFPNEDFTTNISHRVIALIDYIYELKEKDERT